MRCVDVLREVAIRGGRPHSAAVAEHLVHCSQCAAFAERDGKLDELWRSTSPEEPSLAAWDTVWAGIEDGLDRDLVTRPEPRVAGAARPWRRRVLIFGLGQAAAAALLIAVLSRSGPRHDATPGALVENHQVVSEPSLAEHEYVFEEGEVPVIRADRAGKLETTNLALNQSPIGVDPTYLLFNEVEGIAVQ